MGVMANVATIFITMILAMPFICYDNNVIVEGRNFSQEEYSQRKAYAKMMTKLVVMSIKTIDGDVYDCVDIYKQPAFDHHLLGNHILQMEPTSYPNKAGREHIHHDIQYTGLLGEGCPNGTVPIRRTQKSDILNTKQHLHIGTYYNFHHHAIASTPKRGEYYGTRVIMNIWNPKIGNVYSNSASQIWIAAGPESSRNIIEVGLIVHPRVNGDYKTRVFVYWTTDGYRTGCYNLRCPGFIQINRRVPVDDTFNIISTYKGRQVEVQFDVLKDPKSGHWFLFKDNQTIGYWPHDIFNYLNTKAKFVQWGGQVAQCGGCPFPQMGSGYFPDEGYGASAYMRNIKVIDNADMTLKYPQNVFRMASKPKCYRVQQGPVGTDPLSGYHIFYGGHSDSC